MFWINVGLSVVLAWAIMCAVLTTAFLGRLAFIAIRDRLREPRRDRAASNY